MTDGHDHPRPWETTRRGMMLLVSSPSGAGKTSLSRRLVADHSDLMLSISCTTRAPRPGEEEGREYYFVDRPTFDAMIARGEFLEWADVHDNRYGTPKAPVMAALEAGKDVLFDIDWQGARQLQEKMAADVVSIFVLPPTMTELQSRLHRRAEDTEEVIQTRLANSRAEIEHWREYDYVILNDDLSVAFDAVQSIVKAERLRRDRRHGLFEFVTKLVTEKPVL